MKILDIFKKEKTVTKKPKNQNLLGVVANDDFATGLLEIVPNPDKVLQKKGIGIEGYYDLLYDSHLSSVVQSRKAGVLSLEWDIDREQEPTETSEYVKAIFNNLDIRNIIDEMLDAVLYGYKPLEIYWVEKSSIKIDGKDVEGNWLIPLNIVGKPPHWFRFNSVGELVFKDMNTYEGKVVNPQKFLIARHQHSSDNPYGKGVLSTCFWPVQFKKGTFAFWAKYAEKYGTPYLVGKYDETMSSYDANSLQILLHNIIAGGTGVVDKETDIEVINAASSVAAESYDKLISYLNQEMSKAVLSQTLTTEQGKVGSQALGTVHQDVKQEIAESDKYIIESLLNKFIKLLIDLNFGKQSEYPEFGLYEKYNPMTEIDNAVKLMNTGKIIFTENFYNRIGYDPDEYEISKDNPNADILHEASDKNSDVGESGVAEFSENEDIYEKIQKELTDKFDKVNQKVFSELLDKINKMNSFEEIEEYIQNAFSDIDEKEITEIIESLVLASHYAGRENG
jgi:phage gp29-like protein